MKIMEKGRWYESGLGVVRQKVVEAQRRGI